MTLISTACPDLDPQISTESLSGMGGHSHDLISIAIASTSTIKEAGLLTAGARFAARVSGMVSATW
jgi:hypothetical protein